MSLGSVEKAESRQSAAFDVEIASVATAVPVNQIPQSVIIEQSRLYYPQFAHMESLYGNAGISTRYFCEPTDWYTVPRSWEERTASFQRHALDLLEEVSIEAVAAAGLTLGDISAIVTNSTTGLAVPSIDAMLMNRLDFRPGTERLPIFGIGCGGGVAGIARATRLAETFPGGHVLFLAVELCSLCLRINDPSAAMYVSGALFGDGAGAVVLRNTKAGGGARGAGRVVAMGEHFWPDTESIMGWDVKNDGFGIVLSAKLPSLVAEEFGPALKGFLDRKGMALRDFDGFLFHPGSSKVLDVAEEVLGLDRTALEPSRRVLRDFGNMSSTTVLFVLKQAIESGRRGRHLLCALGPGFSVYFVVVDL
jgi:alkylresorcinol/alkylpyrone synthase